MTLEEAISTIEIAKAECEWNAPLDYQIAFDMAIEALEKQSKWIPVSEEMAKFPCLACDKFSQIFIPCGVVTINNRCYDGLDFMGDNRRQKSIYFTARDNRMDTASGAVPYRKRGNNQ